MRKLIVGCLVTLDGVHGEPRSWASPYFDDDAARRSLQALLRSDAMLMGRTTYEYFAPAWPTASGPYADRVNAIRKYVFSSTLKSTQWNNSTIVDGDPVAAVAELKRDGGGDLTIYGYGRLAQTLLEHDLVDELHVSVHPIVLGSGISMFRPGSRNMPLRLTSVEEHPTGVTTLSYATR